MADKKMTRGEVREATNHIDTEIALTSIARAFPMTAISELRIRRLSDGSGYEFQMMQGPTTNLKSFQVDRVPNAVGLIILNAMRDAVFFQNIETSKQLETLGVVG